MVWINGARGSFCFSKRERAPSGFAPFTRDHYCCSLTPPFSVVLFFFFLLFPFFFLIFLFNAVATVGGWWRWVSYGLAGGAAELVCEAARLRDSCILLAGHRPYRSVSVAFVSFVWMCFGALFVKR